MADDARNPDRVRHRMEIRGGKSVSLELSDICLVVCSQAGVDHDESQLSKWIKANAKFGFSGSSIKRLYRPGEEDYLIGDEEPLLAEEQCLLASDGYTCEVNITPVESFEELGFAPNWDGDPYIDLPEYAIAEQHELVKLSDEIWGRSHETPLVQRGICSSGVEVSDHQDFDLESETKYEPGFLITLFVSEEHFSSFEKKLLSAEPEICVARAIFGPCYVDQGNIVLTSDAVSIVGVKIWISTPIGPQEGDKRPLAELESRWKSEVQSIKDTLILTFWRGIYLVLACMLLGMWLI